MSGEPKDSLSCPHGKAMASFTCRVSQKANEKQKETHGRKVKQTLSHQRPWVCKKESQEI